MFFLAFLICLMKWALQIKGFLMGLIAHPCHENFKGRLTPPTMAYPNLAELLADCVKTTHARHPILKETPVSPVCAIVLLVGELGEIGTGLTQTTYEIIIESIIEITFETIIDIIIEIIIEIIVEISNY